MLVYQRVCLLPVSGDVDLADAISCTGLGRSTPGTTRVGSWRSVPALNRLKSSQVPELNEVRWCAPYVKWCQILADSLCLHDACWLLDISGHNLDIINIPQNHQKYIKHPQTSPKIMKNPMVFVSPRWSPWKIFTWWSHPRRRALRWRCGAAWDSTPA
jgi:hypothetical protein